MSDDTHRDEDLVDEDDVDGYGYDEDGYGYDEDGYGYDEDYVDEDYVELRPAASRGRRLLTVLLVLVLILVVGAGVAFVWVQRQLDPPGEAGAPRPVVIAEGSTADDIGAQLADEGIISSELAWDWYLRINGGGPFQAGEYQLGDDSSISSVVDTLSAGPAPPEERSFTLPEGLTLTETLDALAGEEVGLGFDRATLQALMDSGAIRSSVQPPDQPSNEGILFPETYRLPEGADEEAVLRQLVAQLDSVVTESDVASAQARLNLTPYEILTAASLIEEETKVDAERPMVAQVIYNRIRQGIPLGIDATSRYEAELAGRDRDDVDFESDSPYNTRVNAGLPPTPIASPGRASIEAAINPADGPWLYYVLQDAAGNHLFTEDYEEFLAGKQACADAGLGCG